ncbi:MAG: hypothetical protein HZA20_14565 [Nitrospirae bacterium]|nr:hypothetical protein [Nitrospirota bacterium]
MGRVNIGELLLQYGCIDDEALSEGLKLQQETGQRLGETLVKLGRVKQDDIDWILSKQIDIPFVIVDEAPVDAELISRFSLDFLRDNRILPLFETDDEVMIVTDDPFNQAAIDKIGGICGKQVNVSSGSGEEIARKLRKLETPGTSGQPHEAIRAILDSLGGTRFCRLDFLIRDGICALKSFGRGEFLDHGQLPSLTTEGKIKECFDALGIPFLYHRFENCGGDRLLMVFPLVNRREPPDMPAFVDDFGLYLPADVTFTDALVHGDAPVFTAPEPVAGYTYIATRARRHEHHQIVRIAETAPSAVISER